VVRFATYGFDSVIILPTIYIMFMCGTVSYIYIYIYSLKLKKRRNPGEEYPPLLLKLIMHALKGYLQKMHLCRGKNLQSI
jgi:hypothetical protein